MMETKISPNYRDTMRHQSGYNQVKGKESQNILKMRAHNCLWGGITKIPKSI